MKLAESLLLVLSVLVTVRYGKTHLRSLVSKRTFLLQSSEVWTDREGG